ncbi:hypothetical protein BWI97_08650 [Siphonobacter sp. BAB-5405]|uniref:hypothetical protein n=1 Tax=Siphonobacter sp. BAB-5405 TaxID=1864825 RepID=UPI000C80D5C6|nr:hypothetical protein [Siphonobacter sp. BAB-5405]PMD97668.1 hypothetical protein BWI97_08650 [Siphonobacter sp. BAB-5405]
MKGFNWNNIIPYFLGCLVGLISLYTLSRSYSEKKTTFLVWLTEPFIKFSESPYGALLAAISIAIPVGYLLLKYLDGKHITMDFLREASEASIDDVLKLLTLLNGNQEKILSNIDQANLDSSINQPIIDEEQRKALSQEIIYKIKGEIDDSFIESLKKHISEDLINVKTKSYNRIYISLDEIKLRIRNEIYKLDRRANSNLAIGVIITMMALSLLWFYTNNINLNNPDKISVAFSFLPRLSLVVFVEIFAYFFLRLYKISLNDIKYYQNELTSVEMKLTALELAIAYGEKKDISNILNDFSKAERNFILKKGETTLDIEKSKVDKENNNALIKSITDLIPKKS